MKKKIIIVSISILLVLSIILSINSTSKDKIYLNKNKIENNNKSIAIYLENSSGNYDKTTMFPVKGSGYALNTSKSVCNGNTNISWNNEEWGLELDNIDRENTKCFLYFDKGKTIEEIIPTLNAKTEQPDFSQIATTDEGIFAVSDGMYGGTSYYWRGAATTNYLKFAGFCWRIVRINGDKTIRLIYDGTICHQNGENTTDSIAVQNVAYNIKADRSEYVGWTYEEEKQRPTNNATGTSSNAKTELESWYSANIIGTNTTRVTQGKYCNDRDVANGDNWSSQISSKFIYAGNQRLFSNYSPMLSCSSNDIYTLNVGLITADEVVYAGGKNQENTKYYLYNGQYYWAITPSLWYTNGSYAYMFYLFTNGNLTHNIISWDKPGLRPVINLSSDILLFGNGTIDNPYEVL